jgi:acyl transferase domain-containing protein
VFSARDAEALDRVLRAMADWLDQDQGRTTLPDLCGTLARGRAHLAERVAFVVRDLAALRAALRDRSVGSAFAPAEAVAMRDLYLSGGALDWDRLYPDRSFRRRRLPTYPFERRRCWPAPQAVAEAPRPVSLFDAVIRDLGAVP